MTERSSQAQDSPSARPLVRANPVIEAIVWLMSASYQPPQREATRKERLRPRTSLAPDGPDRWDDASLVLTIL